MGLRVWGKGLTIFNFQKYDLNIMRFQEVDKSRLYHDCKHFKHTLTQAGLLVFRKQFGSYVWEEELKVLGLPYFYLGDYFLSKFVNLYIIFFILFPALIFLLIGSAISIIVFICENFKKCKICQ